ncbi:MAG: lipopolysaccharide kinase InaA family protein [Planctomycetota bacterium]|jgi:tRNA A-37 threonylcarbamoyl transferase component Bud32
MCDGDYISENWSEIFISHGLSNFESLWELQLGAIDEPNIRRVGWSQVFRWSLSADNGDLRKLIVKRQQNYMSRTAAHPIRGIPTLRKEFHNIQRCHRLGIPTMEVVYYGERNNNEGLRAILVTEYLEKYIDLNQLAHQWQQQGSSQNAQKTSVIKATAFLVSKLHNLGLKHGHLYPKHILVNLDNGQVDVRLLDLESVRFVMIGNRHRIIDLSTLNRRSRWWSNSDKLRFLCAYLGIERLDSSGRRLCRRILRRTMKKNREK